MGAERTERPCSLLRSAAAETAGATLTVMLPTFNRLETLREVLAALERQDAGSGDFEVVVVDDGSTDGTAGFLKKYATVTALNFTGGIMAQNGGPAAARNAGLDLARGNVIVIIGDDIMPPPDFVGRHRRWHETHPHRNDALLGYVTWPEVPAPSPFMRWLEGGGRAFYFRYADLEQGERAGPIFFYTCNVSLKKALLDAAGPFDESFPFASHEDLELGVRLDRAGMLLRFDREAKAFHHHSLTVPSAVRRVYLMGHSAAVYWGKVGENGSSAKKLLRGLIRGLCATPPVTALWKRLCAGCADEEGRGHLYFYALLSLSYWIGLADSKAGRPPRDINALVSRHTS